MLQDEIGELTEKLDLAQRRIAGENQRELDICRRKEEEMARREETWQVRVA